MIKDIEVTTAMINDDVKHVYKNLILDRQELGHLVYRVCFTTDIYFELTLDLYTKQIRITNCYRNDDQREFAKKEFEKFGLMAKKTNYYVQHIFKLTEKNMKRVTDIFMISVRIDDLIKHNSI